MKKQNDIILISLVIIIVLLIIWVNVSINLILGENGIIRKIKQVQGVNIDQTNDEETKMQTKIDNIYEIEK